MPLGPTTPPSQGLRGLSGKRRQHIAAAAAADRTIAGMPSPPAAAAAVEEQGGGGGEGLAASPLRRAAAAARAAARGEDWTCTTSAVLAPYDPVVRPLLPPRSTAPTDKLAASAATVTTVAAGSFSTQQQPAAISSRQATKVAEPWVRDVARKLQSRQLCKWLLPEVLANWLGRKVVQVAIYVLGICVPIFLFISGSLQRWGDDGIKFWSEHDWAIGALLTPFFLLCKSTIDATDAKTGAVKRLLLLENTQRQENMEELSAQAGTRVSYNSSCCCDCCVWGFWVKSATTILSTVFVAYLLWSVIGLVWHVILGEGVDQLIANIGKFCGIPLCYVACLWLLCLIYTVLLNQRAIQQLTRYIEANEAMLMDADEAVWRAKVQEPAKLLVKEYLPALEVWDKPLSAWVLGCLLAIIIVTPRLLRGDLGHAGVFTIASVVPILLLVLPALVTMECQTLMKRLHHLQADGVGSRSYARASALSQYLAGLNSGSGMGYTLLGQVVNVKLLVSLSSAMVTILGAALGHSDE
jgi:hypothetical protein